MALQPVKLLCEYQRNPLGLDAPRPRLSWALTSDAPGQHQTAYRISVASTETQLAREDADLWDSGRVESDETLHIPYGGPALDSGTRCWWRVEVWDKDGNPGNPSAAACWEMALLEPADWQAKWIAGEGQSPLFRRAFITNKPVRSARLYICGLGVYETFLDGHSVGDQPLAPQVSFYPKRALYDTYDVTGQLTQGIHALGVWLAPGWFGDERTREKLHFAHESSHALIAQLCIEYADGTGDVVATDPTWRTAPSGLTPVPSHWVFCFGFAGESFDGLAQPRGWDAASFDDASWATAREVSPPTAQLRARSLQPNRVVEVLQPVDRSVITPAAGNLEATVATALDAGERNWGTTVTNVHIRGRWAEWMSAGFARPDSPLQEALEFDFGRHVSGWAELTVHGEPGDWICLFGLDWHRLRGGPGEVVRLRFAHRAFRYVPVYLHGQERAPRVEAVRALGIQNDIPSVGRFSSSDPTLNHIHDAAGRTWKTLMLGGMPMDSWQERFGTTLAQNLEPSLYWQSLGAFYTKWMDDHADAQRPDGFIPTSGGPIGQDYWSSAVAQAAPLLVPWLMWRFYGDLDIVKRGYAVARQWLKFAEPPENDLDATWKPPAEHGECELCIGDHGRFTARWYEPRWGDLIETLFIIQFFQAAQELATLLGEDEDTARFASFIERLRAKVNRPEFFDAARGAYADNDQGCHATALWTGVVPEESRGRVEAELFRDILESRRGHMNTGFVGTWFLLKLLDRLNRPEVAYQIVTADSPPSWKTLLHHPSSPERLTMLTEFFTGGMVPHPGWCSVGLWFYQSLAGIHPDPAGPGFKRILIRPRIVPGVAWAEGEYDSLRGTIRSRWEQDGKHIVVSVTVPPNTWASIQIPARARSTVRESGHVAGIGEVRTSDGSLTYQVEPGLYRFEVSLTAKDE